jgi:hypothetical protein
MTDRRTDAALLAAASVTGVASAVALHTSGPPAVLTLAAISLGLSAFALAHMSGVVAWLRTAAAYFSVRWQNQEIAEEYTADDDAGLTAEQHVNDLLWEVAELRRANGALLRQIEQIDVVAAGQQRTDRLLGELELRITALQNQLQLERATSNRSNLLFFWSGVAISIPIGVIINLVVR